MAISRTPVSATQWMANANRQWQLARRGERALSEAPILTTLGCRSPDNPLPELFAQEAIVRRTTANPMHRMGSPLTPEPRDPKGRDSDLPGSARALFLPCHCLLRTNSRVCHTDEVVAVPSGKHVARP
ncbi:hypothetical protein T08_12731 [Trichinella sp. T8]|nr:hypothetical protein T08_12731 [Trichinella sp. T8]